MGRFLMSFASARRCDRESVVDDTSIWMAPASTFYCFPVNSTGDLPWRCNAGCWRSPVTVVVAQPFPRLPAAARGHNSPPGRGYRKIPIVRERHIRIVNTSLGRMYRRRCQIRSVFNNAFREAEQSRTADKIDRCDYGYFVQANKIIGLCK